MNILSLDLDTLSEAARRSLLTWAERWKVSPGEAAVRLLDAAAKRRKPRTPDQATR
jgi:hypothetical protein